MPAGQMLFAIGIKKVGGIFYKISYLDLFSNLQSLLYHFDILIPKGVLGREH